MALSGESWALVVTSSDAWNVCRDLRLFLFSTFPNKIIEKDTLLAWLS